MTHFAKEREREITLYEAKPREIEKREDRVRKNEEK
jgi:hypothetical protein